MQVIEGSNDVEAALANTADAAPPRLGPLDGPPSLTGPGAAVPALPGSEQPARHAESSSFAAAAPSALRLLAKKEPGGRHVRVELGAAAGWGRDSSSLIALPHGMEAEECLAVLTPRPPLCGAPRLATVDSGSGGSPGTRASGPAAGDAGGGVVPEGTPAATALLFLFLKTGKVLRFQARL